MFWVSQGILRSTDLRDSLDEQTLADIVASIVSDEVIERSKDALDDIYEGVSETSRRVQASLQAYDSERLAQEIKYCIECISRVVESSDQRNLRRLIFENKTTNAFPTVFSTILLAVHEISFSEGKVLSDPKRAADALTNLQRRINTRRDSLKPQERRNNINTVKGLLADSFVVGDVSTLAFGHRRVLDVANTIRRAQIETPENREQAGLNQAGRNL